MKMKYLFTAVIAAISILLFTGAQNFTDDTYAPTHVAATDLQNIEYNFAALKSNFSGTSAPSNPVGLMWWADTTNNILKIRNSGNTAWLDVYDFANQVFMAGVDDGLITADMIASAARKASIVSGQAISPSSVTATGNVGGATLSASTSATVGSITLDTTEFGSIDGAIKPLRVVKYGSVSGGSSLSITGLSATGTYELFWEIYSNSGSNINIYVGSILAKSYTSVVAGGHYAGSLAFSGSNWGSGARYSCDAGYYSGTLSQIQILGGSSALNGRAWIVQIGP